MNPQHSGVTPKMRPIAAGRTATVAALDIGTGKIACLIARLKPQAPREVLHRRTHGIEILGFGHAGARGMKGGTVVDLVEAEAAVRQAVSFAESKAGVELESAVVSVSGGRPRGELFEASIGVSGPITESEIARVLAAGGQGSVRDGRAVLHSLPISYTLDQGREIRDPRGMLGSQFGVDMHVVTADVATVRNLMLSVEPRWRCSRAAASCTRTDLRSAATTSPWIWRAG
jgi:cell division protein FtsA